MFLSKESYNLLLKSLNPILLYKLYAHYIKKIISQTSIRISNPTKYYPPIVLNSFNNLKYSSDSFSYNDDDSLIKKRMKKGALNLIGTVFKYNNNPEWDIEYDDIEITYALHRWSWLLMNNSEKNGLIPYNQGILLMQSWIENQMDNKVNKAWASYTVSERIANTSIYFKIYEKIDKSIEENLIPIQIKHAVLNMLGHLSKKLEYRGSYTNNHIINNGRALYLGGITLGSEDFINLGKAIIINELNKFVTKDGFFSEGSSHYHFLFTKWILEMIWFAKTSNDQPTFQYLEPYGKRLVEKCWFFLVHDKLCNKWDTPLFGDISPDCTPEWLLNLPWSSIALDMYNPENLPPVIASTVNWNSLWENK